MEDNKILKLIYTFFVGVLLALFVGVGISTFYPGPTAPTMSVSQSANYSKEPTQQELDAQKAFDIKMEAYNQAMKPYNRNVSMIALAAAILFLATSLFLERKRVKVISDGVMLGGLLTLFYSLGRGFASEDSKYVFIVVTIGLMIALYLGYDRFVRPRTPTSLPAERAVVKS